MHSGKKTFVLQHLLKFKHPGTSILFTERFCQKVNVGEFMMALDSACNGATNDALSVLTFRSLMSIMLLLKVMVNFVDNVGIEEEGDNDDDGDYDIEFDNHETKVQLK